MTSEITSSPMTEEPKTQNEPERLLMPENLLKAAILGNETELKQILGLGDEEQDQTHHTEVSVDVPPMEPSDCLRSITGMEDTILHILSANGHENLLFAIGTKDSLLLKACNARNETPFHHAARFGHKNAISELIGCAESRFGNEGLIELLRRKNFFGETALHEAARHGHGDVVSTLMERDAELAGLVNNDFVSPLYLATARGSLEMVKNMVAKMLTHQITSEYYSGPQKQTALHAAVLHSPELTEKVLQLFPEELGKGTDEIRKILHLVVLTGNCEIAKLLLDKDRSLAYIKDSDESFPVHIAVRMGHLGVFSLLLLWCLDSGQLLDGNGRNFLHIAIEAKRYDIMYKFMGVLRDDLLVSYWKEMFNKMLKSMDNNGNTPIHFVAQLGSIEILKVFVAQLGSIENLNSLSKDMKLNLSLQNQDGLTALDILLIQNRKCKTTQEKYNLEKMYTRSEGNHLSAAYHMSKTELTRGAKQDDIPTTDSTGPNKSSESVMTRAQLVGLGSVLIATVSFAAAFTLPGGTNQETGTPVLGRKYLFKAFVLADFSAFFLSFISTALLMRSSTDENSDYMKRDVDYSLNVFHFATKCMVMALALGLYLVLAPVGHTATIVLVLSILLIIYDPAGLGVFKRNVLDKLFTEDLIQRRISDGIGHQYLIRILDLSIPPKILFQLYFPIVIPLFFIFVFALI